jgi:hypothetical protein
VPRPSNTLAIHFKFPEEQHVVTEGLGALDISVDSLPDKLKSKVVSTVELYLQQLPVVESFGQPFSNPGHPSERWLFENKPIVGDVSLSHIMGMEEFAFIVLRNWKIGEKRLSDEELGDPFEYPYGQGQS